MSRVLFTSVGTLRGVLRGVTLGSVTIDHDEFACTRKVALSAALLFGQRVIATLRDSRVVSVEAVPKRLKGRAK